MTLKIFLLAILCFSPIIRQIKAKCYIYTSQNATIKPKFFRNYDRATSLITNTTQGIELNRYDSIIARCETGFVNHPFPGQQDIKFYCKGFELVINDHETPSFSADVDCKTENIAETCNIEFPVDKAVRPTLFKKFGTRTPPVIPEKQTTIQNEQELIAKCDTKFKSPNNESTKLNLTCLNGKMIALGYPYYTKYDYLECEPLKLYESSIQFPWCPSTMVSYLLARPSAKKGVYEYLAGICYDLKQMLFKSLYYVTTPSFDKCLPPSILKKFEPLVEITAIDVNFISTKTYSNENSQTGKKFDSSNFKSGSIQQNPRLYFYMIQSYHKLLNIDWWPGLQWRNWQLYEKALVKRVENDYDQFELLAGVSPPYVWNYLSCLERPSSIDVVIIGVNTPFYNLYDKQELIFCKDICHDIVWLNNTRRTFRYRPWGEIFCCYVQDVVTSGKLDGFAVPREPETFT